jgi:hypothetical protein
MLDAERASQGANLNTPAVIIRFVFQPCALSLTEGLECQLQLGLFMWKNSAKAGL